VQSFYVSYFLPAALGPIPMMLMTALADTHHLVRQFVQSFVSRIFFFYTQGSNPMMLTADLGDTDTLARPFMACRFLHLQLPVD
jgi:hypothetical protein